MKKRTKTNEDKFEILGRIWAIWSQNPELRLGQLICNVFSDPYYIEDYELIEHLEDFYLKLKKGN